MSYYPATPFVPQFFTDTGVPLSGGTITAIVAGTPSTPAMMYLDAAGTQAGAIVTLNARGEPQVSGDTVVIWLEDSVSYKFILKDASGVSKWTIDDIFNPGAALGDSTDPAKGDALVAVKNPGSNTVARTQHQKNADTASVYDYLFDSDNGDIGAAINRAVADAGDSGFELLIPPSPTGSYWELRQPVFITKPGFTLRGCGTQGGELAPSITPKGVVIRQSNGANLSAAIWVRASGCRLQNLTIDGNAANQTGGDGVGIYIYEPTGAAALSFTMLDNISITGTRGQGILARPQSGGVLDRMCWINVNVRDTYGNNVELTDVGDSALYRINCGGAFNMDANNFKISSCRRLRIFDGLADFAGNGIAISIYLGSELSFHGVQAEAAGRHGWYIDGTDRITLVDCQARGNGRLADATYGGLVLAGGFSRVKVEALNSWDEKVTKTQGYGLILAGTGTAYFTDCDFENNGAGAISSSAGAFANKYFTKCAPFQQPSVSAYRASGANVSVANTTFVKIIFNTTEFDTCAWYDATTGRFFPKLPGKYSIATHISFAAAAATGSCLVTLYKNGVRYKDYDARSLNAANGVTAGGSLLVPADGVNDYFEVFVWQNSGGAIDAQASNGYWPTFSAVRVSD